MGQPMSVLYVEDNPDIQMIGCMALSEIGGLSVHPCSSAKEALAAAATFTPDLLLLDVIMPGMNGPALLQELRKRPALSQVPAVFMTARVQPDEVEQYFQLGAVKVVSKPFDPLSLADDLRRVVAA